jgi:hypothetical protein
MVSVAGYFEHVDWSSGSKKGVNFLTVSFIIYVFIIYSLFDNAFQ